MDVSDAQKLKGLEDENTRLKHLVADLSLAKEVLKASSQKTGRACRHEEGCGICPPAVEVSERRAWKLMGMDRGSYRYEPTPDPCGRRFALGTAEPGMGLEFSFATPWRQVELFVF